MNGWIRITEIPFVWRELPIGVRVPWFAELDQLSHGEIGVDQRNRHGMEGQIPGCEPRIRENASRSEPRAVTSHTSKMRGIFRKT